jgi:CRISPR-associated protein Cas2
VLILVCYDVNTETKAGRRRLRRVAKVCESTGQRVQKSVFECQVDKAGFEKLERRLLAEVDLEQDCLRLYRLLDSKGAEVKEHGRFEAVDFEGPLVL